MPMKITKSCKFEGTTRSTDIDIEGAGVRYVQDGYQVFSESFLLLSTTSGSTIFTLTPRQVVAPKLPNLLSEEESQELQSPKPDRWDTWCPRRPDDSESGCRTIT